MRPEHLPLLRHLRPLRSQISGLLLAGMMVAAFILRGRYFGSPALHNDEQFYLLVGDRLLNHGALPYVDIWDRKPLGLFLLYGAIRLLGGVGVVQYQVVATLFAGATAAIIALWGARLGGGRVAGVSAGLFYLVFIHKFSGYGGQAEVFLNLLTVGSAYLLASRLLTRTGEVLGQRLLMVGAGIMLLSGLAIQLKPTAVFPGFFLGLALIWLGFKAGWSKVRIAIAALLWASIALLPTALVVASYAVDGHLQAFMFANVYSVSMRQPVSAMLLLERFRSLYVVLSGTLILTALEWWQDKDENAINKQFTFILSWLAFGLIACLVVGTYYAHYALISVPMICVLLGMVAKPKGLGWLAIVGMIVMSVFVLISDTKRLDQQRLMTPVIYGFSRVISDNLDGRCLFVYRGPSILYHLTQACIPSRFAFPYHLSLNTERDALGVDPAQEVKRILATRPSVVVFGEAPVAKQDNTDISTLVRETLKAHYHPIATTGTVTKPSYTAYKLNRSTEQPN